MCDLNEFIEAEVNNLIVCENTQNVFRYNHKNLKEFINYMIVQELQNANDKFPLFQSRHEAYGVMREELKESIKEMNDIEDGIDTNYWNFCLESKKNGAKDVLPLLDNLEITVNKCIIELIQVGAMVKKAIMLEKRNDKT